MKLPFGYELRKIEKQVYNREPDFVRGQTHDKLGTEPFVFDYIPLKFNFNLYRMLREAIPVFDVIPILYNRLIGDFDLIAENESDQPILDDIKETIPANWFQWGINAWLSQMRDSALSLGFAVSEIVPNDSMTGINRLKNCKSDLFRFMTSSDGNLEFGQYQGQMFKPTRLENQEYIKYLAYDLRDGHPQGYSIYYSLPFVGEVIVKIQNSIGQTVERIGSPSFVAVASGGEAQSEASLAKLAGKIEDALYNVWKYKREGKQQDVVVGMPKGGNLDIKVLGADGQMMNLEYPYRYILEQVIAKFEIPPFMLGLYKWDSRQTMSGDQRDALTSKLMGMRRQEDHVIDSTVSTILALNGLPGLRWHKEWHEVGLKDEVESARAFHLEASAKEKIMNYVAAALMAGLMEPDDAIQTMRDNGIIKGKSYGTMWQNRVVKNLFTAKKQKALDKIVDNIGD